MDLVAAAPVADRQVAYQSSVLQDAIAASGLAPNEQLALSTCLAEGSLRWGPVISGADNSDFFRFFVMEEGRGTPPPMHTLNCWELLQMYAWRLGQIDEAWIKEKYSVSPDRFGAVPSYDELGYRPDLPVLDPAGGPQPKVGDVVFFIPGVGSERSGSPTHVVLAVGGMSAMSLWNSPGLWAARFSDGPGRIFAALHARGRGPILAVGHARLALVWLVGACAGRGPAIASVPATESPATCGDRDAAQVNAGALAEALQRAEALLALEPSHLPHAAQSGEPMAPLALQDLADAAHRTALELEALGSWPQPAYFDETVQLVALHHLAGTAIEFTGRMPSGFYGVVFQHTVDLHHLRVGQLMAACPALDAAAIGNEAHERGSYYLPDIRAGFGHTADEAYVLGLMAEGGTGSDHRSRANPLAVRLRASEWSARPNRTRTAGVALACCLERRCGVTRWALGRPARRPCRRPGRIGGTRHRVRWAATLVDGTYGSRAEPARGAWGVAGGGPPTERLRPGLDGPRAMGLGELRGGRAGWKFLHLQRSEAERLHPSVQRPSGGRRPRGHRSHLRHPRR